MFRRWISPLIIVIAIAGLWFTSTRCVFACSCIMPGTPQEEITRSDAVFSGKVTQLTPTKALDGTEAIKVSFEVGQVWKGQIPQELLVETSSSSASCGYSFESGKEYLVYAYSNEGQLSVGLCSRTALLADAQEDVTALGQSTAPVAAPEASPTVASGGQSNQTLMIIGGLVAVAAVAAIGGWRYTRRA
ncbi:MAG TPA: hypothetical protein VGD58_24870 [Herpetosiphonaceae bacterium]